MSRLMASTVLVASISLGAFGVSAGEITVMSWGGAYTKSQVEAYHKPWMAKTGNKLKSVDAPNPAAPIKAQVIAKNVSIDVADVEYSDAVQLCDEGLLETIDAKMLPPCTGRHIGRERFHRWCADRLRRRQHRLVDDLRL